MPHPFFANTGFVLLLLAAVGCGAGYAPDGSTYSAAPSPAVEAGEVSSSGDLNLALVQNPAAAGEAPQGAGEPPRLQRKIIYHATLDLVVEDFAGVAARVEELARKHEAFIANSSIDTATRRPRSGSWTIRVPASRYDAFLAAAGTLGELQRRTESSREVTAEYYDLQTRIRNKDLEEKRLLKHLEESTGKLEEILAVEKEISRVRTEMEQMQGQLRVLQDLTALSTVTLNVSELQGYVPVESPTFGTRISRAWAQSLDGLLTAAQLVVIAVVAVTPWLVVIFTPIVAAILLLRRLLRRKGTTAAG
jgi:hypothetical protein